MKWVAKKLCTISDIHIRRKNTDFKIIIVTSMAHLVENQHVSGKIWFSGRHAVQYYASNYNCLSILKNSYIY